MSPEGVCLVGVIHHAANNIAIAARNQVANAALKALRDPAITNMASNIASGVRDKVMQNPRIVIGTVAVAVVVYFIPWKKLAKLFNEGWNAFVGLLKSSWKFFKNAFDKFYELISRIDSALKVLGVVAATAAVGGLLYTGYKAFSSPAPAVVSGSSGLLKSLWGGGSTPEPPPSGIFGSLWGSAAKPPPPSGFLGNMWGNSSENTSSSTSWFGSGGHTSNTSSSGGWFGAQSSTSSSTFFTFGTQSSSQSSSWW